MPVPKRKQRLGGASRRAAGSAANAATESTPFPVPLPASNGDPSPATARVGTPTADNTGLPSRDPAASQVGLTGEHEAMADLASSPHATAWTELDMRCPTCNIIHYVPVCVFLNAEESPHLAERVRKGQFNLKRCPLCRKIEAVDYPYTYYDPHQGLAVQVRSAWEWNAGGGEEWYAARLEDFFEVWQDQDVRIDVVFGVDQLIEKYLGGAGGTESAGS